MRTLLLFFFACALLSACRKHDTAAPPPVGPPAVPATTPKLIVLASRELNSTPSLYSACLTVFDTSGSIIWKRSDIGQNYSYFRWVFYSNKKFFFSTVDLDLTKNTEYDYLYALDAETGKTIWVDTSRPEVQTFILPAFYKDTMYMTSTSLSGKANYIYGFNTATGAVYWRYQLPSTDPTMLGIQNGDILYLKSAYSYDFIAFDLKKRAVLWSEPVDGHFTSVQLNTIGNLIFMPTNGGITAFDKFTGSNQWFRPENPIKGISTGKKLLFLNNNDNAVFAVDPAAGNTVWEYRLTYPTSILNSPYGAGDNIFLSAVDDTGIYYSSLSAATGAVNWKKYYDFNYTGMFVVGNTVFAIRDRNLSPVPASTYIMKFDARSGALYDSIPVTATDAFTLSIVTASDSVILGR